MLKKHHIGALLGAAAMTAMLAAPANAVPVTEWDYAVTAAFSSATSTFDGPGNGPGFTETPGLISWGDPGGTLTPDGGRSGLGIGNSPAIGSVMTDGAAELANNFTHFNNVVSLSFPTLESATIDVMISLTPSVPATPGNVPLDMMFQVNFLETPNNGSGGTCADGTPVGANGPGCRDIFAIELGDLEFPFEFDDNFYNLTFSELTGILAPLGGAPCAAVGLAADCIGFMTEEEADTTAQFQLAIESVEVPAP
ncbi:MAG: THxN family PEP-CTERM protein, partial [Pseudomonadota bacterium]